MKGNSDKKPSDRRGLERSRLIALRERQPLNDELTEPGVLLSDVIRRYCQWFDLISPFNEDRLLKPACYRLTIGDQYAVAGKVRSLSGGPSNNEVRIPPFAVAIVKTEEMINMPPFLIGRWNIQVSRAYQGLVWVGGPQVDAGYVGHLFCPIYNLSDREVVLHRGEPIAVIDFVKTTRFNEGKSKRYDLPKRILFEDYNPEGLGSGLVKHADIIRTVRDRVENFVSLTFGVIAVLFAALTIFVARPNSSPAWNFSLFMIGGLAIYLSMIAWLNSKPEGKYFGRTVQVIIIVLLMVGIGTEIFRRDGQQAEINKLEKQVEELKMHPSVQPDLTSPRNPRASRQSVNTLKKSTRKSP